MTKLRKKRRGLAILTTLLVLVLLLGLIAAFLTVNRAGNRFTVSSVERRQAQDAVLTALSYAWYNLEQNRDFGTGTFSGTESYPVAAPVLRLTKSLSGDTATATGDYSPVGNFAQPLGNITLTIRNNLRSTTPLDGVVPQRSVLVKAEVQIGGVSRKLETLLKPEPPSHEGLGAGRNLLLDDVSGLLRIASQDPYVNRIRAGDDLFLPSEDDVRFVKHGVAASTDRLMVGGSDLAAASDAAIQSAGDVSGGTYQPNATDSFKILDMDEADLSLPTNNSNLEGGTWTFGDITHYEYKPQAVPYEFDVPNPGGVGHHTVSGSVNRYRRRSSLYNVLTSPTGRKWAASTAIPGSTGVWEPPPPPTYDSVAGAASYGFASDTTGFVGPGAASIAKKDAHQIAPGFKANVVTAQLVVNPGYKINFSGNFIVEGEGDRKPELYFGYDMTLPDGVSPGGVVSQEFDNGPLGIESAKNDPASYMGVITTTGDFDVKGGVLGYGSMLADGNVTVKASSGLRTAPGLGVIVKGQNIVINPATEPEPALPGEPINTDHPVLSSAISGDWADYNDWLNFDAATRNARISDLKGRSAGSDATTLWGQFNTQIGGGGTLPALTGWPSTLTVEHYVRLKEFYQTRATGYNAGLGDETWLDLSARQVDAEKRIASIINDAANWAKSYKKTLQEAMTTPPTEIPDMYMQGLVYAEDNITINASGALKLEGAVVAKNGDLRINDATNVDVVYDRGMLDDLVSGGPAGSPIKLEKVFFILE